MSEFLLYFLYFIGAYMITFLLYTLFINKKKKPLLEIDYLVSKNHLNTKKQNMTSIRWILNIINPFIVATTFIVVIKIENIFLGVIVGFAVMLLLVYALYEIIGRILKGKEK